MKTAITYSSSALSLLAALAQALLAPAVVADGEVLLFSFFRGNGEAGTYLAWSEDGVHFQALNDDKPVFPPAPWPGQNLTRDPSLIYRDGKFRAVWTSSWKGRVFGYAESADLVDWSEPVQVQPFPDFLPAEDQPQNIWAPEIHWDPAQKNYAILFSSTTERESGDGDGSNNNGKDGNDHRIYITRTTDGKTFSPAKLFFDQGFSVIDAQMAPAGERWVMAVKHEQEIPLGGKNLRLTFAPLDLSKPWSPVSAPVFGPGSPIRPHEKVEGACLLKWNGLWHLYTDAFASRHYSMATSPDLKAWTDRTGDLVMPPDNPRHGTVFRAPRSAVGFFKPVAAAGASLPRAQLAAEPFDLRDVKLLEGPFKEAQERDKGYILRVEVDRLMHWWRVNNGLSSKAAPYGEWKAKDYAFQGHYEGHYLSACAQMFRSTGDLRFKERLDQTVAIIAEVQSVLGTGFMAPFPEQWMRIMAGLDARPAELGRLPVPWYALHKVYQGLLDAHTLAGNQQAIDIMNKVADWLECYSAQIRDEAFQKMLDEEHGGINEALANLYAITKNPAHLALAKRFCHRKVMDPLARNEDTLDWLHANTQVPKFTGFARICELTGEPEYRDAARNFWRYVVEDRSYANGGNSNHEKFTPKAHLSLSLSKGNAETCNTHNMLKLTRHLFMWEPSSVTADYYERAQINHILSSQHPKHGTVAYFHAMESGNRKNFSPGWVSFACCHGSGMENHAKYGDSIYFHRGGGRLFVNLFIGSEVDWRDAGLVVLQATKFPEEAGSTLKIVCAKGNRATLSIRKPGWATIGFAVKVNGETVSGTTGPEGYVDVTRVWKAGDEISVALPMALRWESFRDNPDRAALLFGPAMLVAKTENGNRQSVARKPADQALAAIRPADKPLHFNGDPAVFLRDFAAKSVNFLPLYQEYEDPYIAYWDLRDEARLAADRAAYEAEAKRWKSLAARTVDIAFYGAGTPCAATTLPGRLAADAASPRTAGAERTEAQHMLEAHSGYNHEFNLPHRVIAGYWQTFRTAELGTDRFGWTLAVEPGKPQTLLVRLWSPPATDPDARRATNCGFDVLAAGVASDAANAQGPEETETTTQGNQLDTGVRAKPLPPLATLGTIGPSMADGTFRDVSFPIPAGLTANKDRLIVRLVRQKGKTGGMVAELRVLRD